jgi:hypothetical protein
VPFWQTVPLHSPANVDLSIVHCLAWRGRLIKWTAGFFSGCYLFNDPLQK